MILKKYFFETEFDFTAARGLGALHKELVAEKRSLVLLGPSEEIRHVLKEALAPSVIPTADSDTDLDVVIQGILSDSKGNHELTDVAAIPLLLQPTSNNGINTVVNQRKNNKNP